MISGRREVPLVAARGRGAVRPKLRPHEVFDPEGSIFLGKPHNQHLKPDTGVRRATCGSVKVMKLSWRRNLTPSGADWASNSRIMAGWSKPFGGPTRLLNLSSRSRHGLRP